MAINKIRVKNFKSFKDLELELGDFNVLIGANASGKSNFIQLLKFIRDIEIFNLENAISRQGGNEYISNFKLKFKTNFFINIISDLRHTLAHRTLDSFIDVLDTNYELTLEYKKGNEFKIFNEKMIHNCQFYKIEKSGKKLNSVNGKIGVTRDINGKIAVSLPRKIPVDIHRNEIIPTFLRKDALSNSTFLELPSPFTPNLFEDISFYDFDPKLAKMATEVTGNVELEENGENLSLVLKNIISDRDDFRKLKNLLNDLLPFVENIGSEKLTDKTLLFNLEETFYKGKNIPASIVSDGTINITALIIALYFEENSITIIEEPERNIHPYLISKVIGMMKDVLENNQIIVTTHNPELIKHTNLEDILLVSRDKEGFSTVSRPSEKEEVKVFLENEMGIEDLYVQNLLEI